MMTACRPARLHIFVTVAVSFRNYVICYSENDVRHRTERVALRSSRDGAPERRSSGFAQTVDCIITMRGIADAEQLASLAEILDSHCQAAGFQADDTAREHLAGRIMALFNAGIVDRNRIVQALNSPDETVA